MKLNPNCKSCAGYILLAMLSFMLCVYSSLWADEAPIVDFNLNMPLGSCQELKVLNAREGMTYTFELISGLGNLSGTTYCAPATMTGPADKPVIRVTAVNNAQAFRSSQTLTSRAGKPLAKSGAAPAAASSGAGTDVGIGLYPQNNSYQPYKVFTQPCTRDYLLGCNGTRRLACCWEIIQIKCDGSMRDIDPALNGACCEPIRTPNCGPSCDSMAKTMAKYYPYYYNVPCYPNPNPTPPPPDAEPQSCPTDIGNPVSILDGAKKEIEQDLTLGDLTFTRYYNSFIGETYTVLGQRWNHSFNVFLSAFTNIAFDLKIKEPDGRGLYYKMVSGTSNYVGLYTETSTVTADPTGYTWFKTDGANYRFNLNGRLTGITESNGTTKTLAYDANNRLTSVTDNSSNRAITFVCDSSRRITQVKGPITTNVPDGIYVKFQYDGWKLKDVIYPDNSGFLYLYANSSFPNHLTEKQDRSGRVLAKWTYDSQGRAITDKTLDGRSYTITYGQGLQANEVTVTDAYGQSKKYILTRRGGLKRLFETTNQNGCSSCGSDAVKYSYDANYNIIQKKNANTRVDQYYDFDNRGNPATIIEAYNSLEQRTIQRTYHPRLNRPLTETVASILDPGSKQTIYDYDNDANTVPNENPTNLVYRQIEKGFTKDQSNTVVPFEYVTNFTYNAKGQILSVDGPNPGDQDKVTYAYYTNGDLLSITQPLIGTTIYDQYDAAGLVGRVTDPNGLVTTMTYDARGRIKTRTTAANNAVITYNYNTTGDIASVTDAMGITMTYTYETTYGRLDKITDPIGNYLKYSYDDKGNRIEQGYYKSTNTRTYQMRYNYQHPTYKGKLYKVTNPDNTFTEYNYDNTGNITSIKDPRGKLTTYQYDLFNRIKNVIQPGSILTYYTYDSQDHLITVTDAKNNTTLYTYDDIGRVLSVTSPDTGTATYVYDESNNLISMLDAKNQETRFTYDLLNRVLTKRYYMNGTPASPDGLVIYTYDQGPNAKGKLTLVTDPSGSQAYEYDALGRLELETKVVNAISFQILYGYNKDNELETMTYPSGRVVSYNRNTAGRIDSMSTTYETNTVALIQNMTRLPFGPINGLSLGNGLNQTMAFDQLYRMTGSQTGSIYNRSYVYNPNNNITNIQDLVTPAKNQVFGYDDLNRLTNSTGSYGTMIYTYDAVGNRLSLTKGSQVENYTYQPNTNRLNSISGTNPISYTYDSNGNITGLGPKTLAYTQDNRLLEVQPITPVTDNLKSEYIYNHQGQRTQKRVYKYVAANWQLETENLFIYDIQGNLILEADQSGEILKEYLYLEGNRIAQYGYDDLEMSQGPRPRLAQRGIKPQLQLSVFSSEKSVKKPEIKIATAGTLVGLLLQSNPGDIYGEVLYYYVNDHLGTPQLMVDHEGQVVWRADYDPFGSASVDAGSSTINQHRFPGQYEDEETQLHYNYHRYYDPRSGRYITPDPIRLEGGANLFIYVGNNPVNKIDPKGLEVQICARQSWPEIVGGKDNKWYVVPHCYIVVNGVPYSWHTNFTGGINHDEDPSKNSCHTMKCCRGQQAAFDQCVRESAEADTGHEGSGFFPAIWDCCAWSNRTIGKCWNQTCAKCNNICNN